jgi:hypothetical protein
MKRAGDLLLRVPSHPEKAKEIFPKGRFKKTSG